MSPTRKGTRRSTRIKEQAGDEDAPEKSVPETSFPSPTKSRKEKATVPVAHGFQSIESGSADEYEEEIMVLELNGVLDAESVRQTVRSGQITVRRADGSEPLVQVNLFRISHFTSGIGQFLIDIVNYN
jgi:hypothetical protein